MVVSLPKDFHLGWWASVFPNVGFVLAMLALRREFQNDPVLWFGTAMSVLMLGVYRKDSNYPVLLGERARSRATQSHRSSLLSTAE